MMAAQSRQRWYLLQVGVLLHLVASCFGRIHQLQLTDEKRSNIQVNSFGFFANGTLAVDVDLSFASSGIGHRPIGFSLSHPKSSQFLSSTEQESLRCILEMEQVDKLLLIFNFTSIRADVKKFGNFQQMHVSQVPLPTKKAEGLEATPETRIKTSTASQKNKDLHQKEKSPVKKRDTVDRLTEQGKKISGSDANLKSEVGTEDLYLPLDVSANVYHFSFQIVFSLEEEGLYNLYFHNCNNLQRLTTSYNITVHVTERNPEGFLSAAEIPLFKLYLIMAGSFFIASIVWIHILHKHKYSVFKIHWLMAGLVVTKSISLLFHSINYYFINIEGHPIEGLAVMYYITHLLKGVLLFITIVLIGTGWAFVKYILSDKDKKIFMIVLPLQVLANVAYIIMESTETGTSDYALWTQIVFLVDLICCGAILFPVIWSIRHLQEASTTDGKAAMNLAKLKLFRHYYIMIVCYIYFTRIIAILLKVTVSFQLQWLHEMLVEVSTLVFFVLTGYKFRPASNNPYLQLPQEDEDIQMDEVLTESGALGGLSRVNKTFNGPEAL